MMAFKFFFKYLYSDSSAAIICCKLITSVCFASKDQFKHAVQLLTCKRSLTMGDPSEFSDSHLLHKVGIVFLVIPLILLAFEAQKFSRKSGLTMSHFVQEYFDLQTLRAPGL